MEQSLNKLYIILNISYHFHLCKVAFLQGNKEIFVLITNGNVIKETHRGNYFEKFRNN